VERFGLVGLPNAGKSSLFNALSGAGALAASYPFATVEPNVGVARVPDERLERLSAMSRSARTVPATVEFVDIGGLVEGASTGEGLGNRFLGGIREVDAVVFVLRAFDDPDVVGSTDPLEHLAVVETELALADLASVEERIGRQRKAAALDRSLAPTVAALDAALVALAEGTPIYRSGLSEEHRRALRPWFLLTNKPVLAVVNIGEEQLDEADAVVKPVVEAFAGEEGVAAEVLAVSVQLEAEAALLPPAVRTELLQGLGLGEGALPRLVRAAFALLGRRTFFTTGDKETRAWTFRAGARAPECAGIIHSDFERGFIKAECVHWDALLEIGSWSRARELGRLRVEGKDYEVRDGDVLEIRFNV
jgi:ribosome-binding ATPase